MNGRHSAPAGSRAPGRRLPKRAGKRVLRVRSLRGNLVSSALTCAGPDETIVFMKTIALAFVFLLTVGVTLCVLPSAAQDSPSGKAANASGAKAQTPVAPVAGAKAQTPATPAASAPAPSSPLKDQKDKLSYALGMNLAGHLVKDEIAVDPNLILQGLKDSLAGSKTLLTPDEATAALRQLETELKIKQEVKMNKESEGNKIAGTAFLAENKTKPGVVVLPSGLQYKILTPGTGAKPTASDTVVCNYRGTLVDGKEFDSSYKRGEPAKFAVGGVIKGWTEALQLMPVGSKWELFVPSDLAYGAQGAGASLAPMPH